MKEQLLDLLPEHFSILKEMQEIARIEGKQFNDLHDSVDDLLDQMYIHTATWGLSYWEKRYLLPVLSEDTDYKKRRRRILTKKRSNKANLIVILRAVEPNISLAWGGLVLPFTVETNVDYYDFGELITILETEKPSHLTYSFNLIPNGYTVKANRNDRYSVALNLLSGTANAGRFPRANTRGESLHTILQIHSKKITGVSELQRTAGLVSGGKNTPTAFSSSERSFFNISIKNIGGKSRFNPSGKYESGQIFYDAAGASRQSTLNHKSESITGISDLKSGQVNTKSIGVTVIEETIINSVAPTGVATPIRCGTISASKEVA
ncbi:putative phage tail protein [Lentibacillus sp. N15]|uniref:putative phage tail protein n=1 Tax=Lentibacillus songyuanensis TaxID=3136161 RepID=UPI0031BB8AAC